MFGNELIKRMSYNTALFPVKINMIRSTFSFCSLWNFISKHSENKRNNQETDFLYHMNKLQKMLIQNVWMGQAWILSGFHPSRMTKSYMVIPEWFDRLTNLNPG